MEEVSGTLQRENLAANPEYRKQMDGYNTQLKQWLKETKDPVAIGYLNY